MPKPLQLTQQELRAIAPELADFKKQWSVKVDKKDSLRAAWRIVTDGEEWPFLPEAKFHPERNWRLDFFNAELMLGIEVEGVTGGENLGRHQRAEGYEKDCEKYNAAAAMSITILRYTQRQIQADPHAVVSQILEVAAMLRMKAKR